MQKKIADPNTTPAELRAFGKNYLGLDLPPNCNRETLVSRISAAWEKDHIIVDDAKAPDDTVAPEGGAPPPVLDSQTPPAEGDDLVRIRINITDTPGGNEPVPVSVNGRAMLIPRDKDVEVPSKYVEALEHAVEHRYEPADDGNGLKPEPRLVPKYPFQRVA